MIIAGNLQRGADLAGTSSFDGRQSYVVANALVEESERQGFSASVGDSRLRPDPDDPLPSTNKGPPMVLLQCPCSRRGGAWQMRALTTVQSSDKLTDVQQKHAANVPQNDAKWYRLCDGQRNGMFFRLFDLRRLCDVSST